MLITNSVLLSSNNCLVCNGTRAKDSSVQLKEKEAFCLFCSYMNLDLAPGFSLQELPFCPSCSSRVLSIYELHKQKELLLKLISGQVFTLSSKMILAQAQAEDSPLTTLRKAAVGCYDVKVSLKRFPSKALGRIRTEVKVEYPWASEAPEVPQVPEDPDPFLEDSGSPLEFSEEVSQNEEEIPKRKRGRPKGSFKKHTKANSEELIEFVEPAERRGRPKGSFNNYTETNSEEFMEFMDTEEPDSPHCPEDSYMAEGDHEDPIHLDYLASEESEEGEEPESEEDWIPYKYGSKKKKLKKGKNSTDLPDGEGSDLSEAESKPEVRKKKKKAERKQKESNNDLSHSDPEDDEVSEEDDDGKNKIKKEKEKEEPISHSRLTQINIGENLVRFKYSYMFFDQVPDGFSCNTCTVNTKTFKDMKKHCRTVHTEVFQDRYKNPASLEETEVEPGKYSVYGIEFRKVNDFFECGSCEVPKLISTWKGMMHHVKLTHRDLLRDDQVKQHGLRFTKLSESYRCDKCGTPVAAEEFKAHKLKYHAELLSPDDLRVDKNRFMYGGCVFKKTSNMQKPYFGSVKCMTCEESQPNLMKMLEHLASSHGAEPPIKIGMKPIKYRTGGSPRHSRIADYEIEPNKYETQGVRFIGLGDEFKCEACGAIRSTFHKMLDHVKQHQRIMNPSFKQTAPYKFVLVSPDPEDTSFGVTRLDVCSFKCDICGVELPKLHMFRKHFRERHKAEVSTTSICETCGKGFFSEAALQSHVRSHTEGPWTCPICSRTLGSKLSLKIHQETHQVDMPKPFICEVCGKAFRNACNLKKHTLVHTQEAKEVCPDCGKIFVHQAHMWVHRNTQHIKKGKKDHPCPECGTLFLHKSSIPRHILVAHRGLKPSEVFKRRNRPSSEAPSENRAGSSFTFNSQALPQPQEPDEVAFFVNTLINEGLQQSL